MTVLERIELVLGVNSSQVGPDLEKFKSSIRGAGEEAHKTFLHAGSAGRTFHKLLEQISEQSPIVGNALRFAFSPIVGTMTVAIGVFAAVKRHIEEINQQLDKTAAINAKSIFSSDQLRELRGEQAKLAEEYRKSINERGDGAKLILDALALENQRIKDGLDLDRKRLELRRELGRAIIEQAVSRGQITPQAGLSALRGLTGGITQEEHDAQAKSLDAQAAAIKSARERAFYSMSESEADMASLTSKRQAKLNELEQTKGLVSGFTGEEEKASEQESIVKSQKSGFQGFISRLHSYQLPGLGGRMQRWLEGLRGKANTAAGIQESDVPLIGKGLALDASENSAISLHRQAMNRLDENKDKVQKLKEEYDKLNDQYEQSNKSQGQYSSAVENTTNQLENNRREIEKLNNTPIIKPEVSLSSPYTFSTHELSKYRTPYGRVAREIERRADWSKYYTAAGRPDLAREVNKTVYGYDIAEHDEVGIPDLMAGQKSGAKPGTRHIPMRHVNGLYDLLPKGLTEEQQKSDELKRTIQTITEALRGKEAGIPVTIADIKGE